MLKILNWKVILILFSLTLTVMYQETAAQVKRADKPKTRVSEIKAAAPEIAFSVSMPKPATHLLEVEMRLKWPHMPDQPELKMPVWSPGSYLVREYARHVQDFAVKDSSGREIPWRKLNKNTWQIDAKGAKGLTVFYRVYANELTVRTNELNDEHAFWNNTALLMFPKGQLAAPSTVTVKPFGNWKVATGLPKAAGAENTYRAENFDILYDSPFEVSNFKEITFNVQGKPHRFVVTGEGNYDLNQIAADSTKIAEEAFKIFGELPIDNYLFILNLRGRGGLEHLNSTALQYDRFGFKPKSRYLGFLQLVAHEYFHLWNVKRIRPDSLGPFDYENENYTRLLWFAEGATAYYEDLLLRRAGLITDKELLEKKAGMIEQLQTRPGRFETSLEEASLDAWIKYYRPDENAINNQISYYDKGEIVSMMLDIAIRTSSGGAKSLDDVMRSLYNEFYKKNRNFTPEDLQKTSETMAGKSLEEFFTKYIRGEADIDFDGIVSGIGLQLSETDVNKGKAYIGADTAEENGRLLIRTIPAGTPAYEQGLNTKDQIIAVDGYRATQSFLQSYLDEKKAGDVLKLTIFRFDRLQEIDLTLSSNTRKEYAFVPIPELTPAQERLYKEYLKADLK